MVDFLLLPVLIFSAAVLSSSVGHAGASGYLAAMALCGIVPSAMKPAGWTLNVLVASIATVRFYRAGCDVAGWFGPRLVLGCFTADSFQLDQFGTRDAGVLRLNDKRSWLRD